MLARRRQDCTVVDATVDSAVGVDNGSFATPESVMLGGSGCVVVDVKHDGLEET